MPVDQKASESQMNEGLHTFIPSMYMCLDQHSWSTAHTVHCPRAVQDQTQSKSREVDTHKMNSKELKTVLNNHAIRKKKPKLQQQKTIVPEARKFTPSRIFTLTVFAPSDMGQRWGAGLGILYRQELWTGFPCSAVCDTSCKRHKSLHKGRVKIWAPGH